MIRGGYQGLQVRTFRIRQLQALFKGKLFATQNRFKTSPHFRRAV
jgi:hypothetical protein